LKSLTKIKNKCLKKDDLYLDETPFFFLGGVKKTSDGVRKRESKSGGFEE
jgi:hypothetical protein